MGKIINYKDYYASIINNNWDEVYPLIVLFLINLLNRFQCAIWSLLGPNLKFILVTVRSKQEVDEGEDGRSRC